MLRLMLVLLLLGVGGCAVRDDVTYNPYAPNDGDPTWMQRAEQAAEVADQAVDDLEARLEYTVY